MKTRIRIVFIVSLLLLSCKDQHVQIEPISSIEIVDEIYSGPIIDMHIHAYAKENKMFGLKNYNPLTKKTYTGTETLESHQKETFEKFKKHNIVRAMVGNGSEWYKIDSNRVIIGEGRYNSIQKLREIHANGKLHVLAEVAPLLSE